MVSSIDYTSNPRRKRTAGREREQRWTRQETVPHQISLVVAIAVWITRSLTEFLVFNESPRFEPIGFPRNDPKRADLFLGRPKNFSS